MRLRLKSPASRLSAQPFVQVQIKEITKAPRHWPLWGNSPVNGEFPAQRTSNAETLPFDDVIMEPWFHLSFCSLYSLTVTDYHIPIYSYMNICIAGPLCAELQESGGWQYRRGGSDKNSPMWFFYVTQWHQIAVIMIFCMEIPPVQGGDSWHKGPVMPKAIPPVFILMTVSAVPTHPSAALAEKETLPTWCLHCSLICSQCDAYWLFRLWMQYRPQYRR